MSGNNGENGEVKPKIRIPQIGDKYEREGKCPLVIFGRSHDRKFLVRKLLDPIPENELLTYFRRGLLIPGAILKFPSGRILQLLGKKGKSNHWNVVPLLEILEYTQDELEEIQATAKLSKCGDVITGRCECAPESLGRAGRFMKTRSQKPGRVKAGYE